MHHRLLLLLSLYCSISFGQEIHLQGTIPSEKLNDQIGQITVFAKADSTLKKGSYIDSTHFEVSFNGKLGSEYYAKFKLGGFLDTTIAFTASSNEVDLGIIHLEANLNLDAVEVVYREPAFERTMDGIKVNVSGTTLEQLTNLFEILKASPKLTSPDDERIEIIGKGSPLILIDRQPILSNDELRAIPAEMVEKIEIITNPSAKYKAQGRGSGVIEVYTKDFRLQGYNVTINAAGGLNTQLKPTVRGNIGLSLKKKKFSLNVNLGGNYRENFSFGEGTYAATDDSHRSELTGFTSENSNSSPHLNIKGAYRLQENHKITMGVRGHANFYNGVTNDSSEYLQHNVLLSKKDEISTNGYTWLNGSSFLNYVWETDTFNSAFEVNLNYRLKVDESSATSRNVYTDNILNSTSDFNIQNDSKNRPNIGEFRTSYEHVFDTSGWTMSGGGSYSIVYNGKVFNQYNEENDEWILDPNFSNSYDYIEQNGSLFYEVGKKWKKIGFRMGVSGELTDLDGYSNSLDKQFIDSSYFLLFPSFSLMLEPSSKVGVTLTYSSGIDRPQFSNYDPFVRVEDSLMITYGNPYLLPEVTQSFGLNLDFFYKYNLSVSYNYSKNPQSTLSFYDESTFLVNSTPWNAERTDGLSVSMSIPLKTKWYSGWNSLWLNYRKHSFSPVFEREDFYNLTYGLWSYSTFFLPKNFDIVNRLYIGRWGSGEGIGNLRMNWSVRLAKKMLGNKLKIYIDVDDIFPPINRYESFAGNYTGVTTTRWAFTSFRLGIYFKFGRLKQDANIKESDSKNSGRI